MSEINDEIYERLVAILAPYRDQLITVQDDDVQLYLDTPYRMAKDKPLGFGGIAKRSKYVSFYLMPIYLFPDLMRDISSDLEETMRGRSSFSLTELDEALFEELTELTERGFLRFESEGLLIPTEVEDEDDPDDFDDDDDDDDDDDEV
jgi:hypothetical protein